MRTISTVTITAMVLCGFAFTRFYQPELNIQKFADPIDAISVGVEGDTIDLSISARTDDGWTDWQKLEIEKEFDPILRESNLVLFPQSVSEIRFKGEEHSYQVHPIRLSDDPVRYEVAATSDVLAPKILTRRQWGADPLILYSGESTERSDVSDRDADTVEAVQSDRLIACQNLKKEHPEEFQVDYIQLRDRFGQDYRWPQQFMKEVDLLVVHHTAGMVTGDKRTGIERMRALYEYHSNSRGWGDIGYHYVIDEDGQIYEGRAGGDYVVGGHAYCNNVGSIGVALMGNFEKELPPLKQVQSLQWLLKYLGQKYDVDLSQNTEFHGEEKEPIVGHGDLLSTACPGYFLRGALSQIRQNVRTGQTSVAVTFPPALRVSTKQPVEQKSLGELRPVGTTDISGRPGSQFALQLRFTAGQRLRNRARVATVDRSERTIGLWQEIDGNMVRVRSELMLPKALISEEEMVFKLKIQLPQNEGEYTLKFGDITYKLAVDGRPILRRRGVPSVASQQTQEPRRITERTEFLNFQNSFAYPEARRDIRIRLGYEEETVQIRTEDRMWFNAQSVLANSVSIQREGDDCAAYVRGKLVAKGVVRVESPEEKVSIPQWDNGREYRGLMECRIIDNTLVLINELPLEEYLWGLAEEPDSEPFEKQKAFAIAARSYAAHYMNPKFRKFAGMPYDGDDSPARFQYYRGISFELLNPEWVQAVRETDGFVITHNNEIVRAAYFSSSDGRTKTPDDVGWPTFPNKEVFQAVPDLWCRGEAPRGHGVGMSGCGARGQALEGKMADQILRYYYAGIEIESVNVRTEE